MRKLRLRQQVEQTLAIVLAVAFVAPLILTILRYIPVKTNLPHWLDHRWIGAEHLTGVTTPRSNVSLNWRSIMSGAFQSEKNLQFNENFAGREALIRYTNELWFRLFHDTGNQYSRIAVGEGDVLFEKSYLEEYVAIRTDKAELTPWVKDLHRLQDYCRGIGMGFVVVLTPGKPLIYPEDTPIQWRSRYDPRPRAKVLIEELFRENDIIFVDAINLTAQEKLKGPPAPLFPKGGIHWNERSAFIAANAVQSQFAQENKPTEPVESLKNTVVYQPGRDEKDLLEVMNLAWPWEYPVEHITIKPGKRSKTKQLTMAVVGDSFCWNLLQVLNESEQFSEISFFFHYRLYKSRIASPKPITVREPAIPLDFSREIFAADCLLLELTEATLPSTEHPLSAFVKDALAHLPDPAGPKPPFKAD